ncbi:GNAT family N-acetyltransferase [Sphingomonas sp. ac-8]|uniref:GNAT family N-acetyltransferase n=1 Tax=Sphingomonas sp. ac-8 TaxID=3242977 RepID=UPI003A804906
MSDDAATPWRVREATSQDCGALALVGAATFLESFAGVLRGPEIVAHCARAHAPDAYARYLDDGGRAWLAELDAGAAPVGYALSTRPDLPGAREDDAELKRIYVLSRFQGDGMAAALLQQVVSAAQGSRRLLLGVYERNARALAFYRKHGFAPVGTRRFDVGGTLYDDLVLARPL